ncbi:MAG: PIN domain-containing protein, partial [Deltaproteobacteria bacterium]|nr:PIN domain-containing protein [Deltaproteobacteria bacterium]
MTKSMIFLDSDIILDVFAKREPFYFPAARLFTLIEQKKVAACTSPLVFSNLHYILRRLLSKDAAILHLRTLKTFVSILPVDEQILDLALNSSFSDFEDAIQYYTAKRHNVRSLITRNTKDYPAKD